MKRLFSFVVAPAFGIATLFSMYAGSAAQTTATPPPAPPSPNASAAPTLPPDLMTAPKPKATATPAPPKTPNPIASAFPAFGKSDSRRERRGVHAL